MQIENKLNPSVHLPRLPGQDFANAQQHLADLPMRLALTRWMRGGDIPHPPAPPREMWRRAAWYGGLQTEFQSWLKAGGFHGAGLDDLVDLEDFEDLGVLDDTDSLEAQVTAINARAGRQASRK